MPETGDRHGHHVGGRRAVVGDRRARLRVVPDGPDERAPRGAHIHSGRLPAAGVDGRQAHVVPAHGQPVGRRQRPFVHVQRDAVHRQRVDAVQTGGDAVLMRRPPRRATPHRTPAAHALTQSTHTHAPQAHVHAGKRTQARTNSINNIITTIIITTITTTTAVVVVVVVVTRRRCRH